MLATLNIFTNPFHPHLDRVQKPIIRRVKVQTLVKRYGINTNKPVICYFNGQPLLRADWKRQFVKDGDVVSFAYLPRGGGGSNPLRLVLMIAVMVFAPYLASAIAPGLMAAGGLGATLLTAGIGMLGNALINALIPPPTPPKAQQANQLASASPTYNLSAQGNQARIGQAIPVLYGTMKVYPDFAAQPYAEYEDNNQYLYQLFAVSQGSVEIDENKIFIEDSPLSSFNGDYEVEIVQPNTVSTLFPKEVFNVTEVSGQELLTGSIGPFPVNPALTEVNKLSFDVVLTRGLNYINDEGELETRSVSFRFFAQKIDDAGNNVGAGFIVGTETITGATATAIRRTFKYDVAPGRYEVSVLRLTAKIEDTRYANDIVWASARGYAVATRHYGDITCLALKLKATNTFSSQSSRKINLIGTRKLEIPSYNAETNTYDFSARTATQSIAWAIVDMCRAKYGANTVITRFNIAQLIALNSVWEARGDKLNCTFDSTQTFWEALTMVCRAGRTRPFVQGGLIHFVRDAFQTLPTAMFTSRNIVKGSFKVTYIMPSEDTADAIDVEYFDEVIWKPRIVRAVLDVDSATKPAKVKAFGITNRDQAYKEGMYMAGSNRYRRKEVSFETELEGHIPALGDLIGIQSDIPEWGQSGEVIDFTTNTIISNEPLTWTEGADHYVVLRRPNGSAFGPTLVTRGDSDHEMHIVGSLADFEIYTGYEKEKTFLSFGRSGQVIQLARVLTIVPRDTTVQITAINEDARVHSADGEPIPLDVYEWSLSVPKIKPVLEDFTINQTGSGLTPSISLSWNSTAGASKYIIEKSTDNINWETVGEIGQTNFSFIANVGTLYIRVAAFGGVLGPYITKSIEVGLVPPPADVVTGAITSDNQSYDVIWTAVADSDAYYVEVLNAGSVKRSFNTTTTHFSYSYENAIADGGPWRTITVRIKAKKGNVLSQNFFTLVGTNAAPPAPTLILNPGNKNISISVSPCLESDYLGTVIYASPVPLEDPPNPSHIIYDGVGTFFLATTEVPLYIKAAHYDVYGKTGLNYSNSYYSNPSNGTGIPVLAALPDPSTADEGDFVYITGDDMYVFTDGAWLNAGTIVSSKIVVANLAALSANMGDITSGTITLDNAGHIKGGQTAYSIGSGYWIGYDVNTYKFSMGDSTNYIQWDGSNLNIHGTLNGADGTFAGSLTAATGSFSGELTAATGSFGGKLLAGVIDFASAVGVSEEYHVPGTYTLTVPAGKTTMRVTLVGAGGGGGGSGNINGTGGGGGGSAGIVTTTVTGLTGGETYTLIVGAGGLKGARAPYSGSYTTYGQPGQSGGATIVIGVATSSGGGGGFPGGPNTTSIPSPPNGGSVQGQAGGLGGAPGSNGAYGGNATYYGTSSLQQNSFFYRVGYAFYGGKGGITLSGANGGKGGDPAASGNVNNATDGANGYAIIEYYEGNAVVLQEQYSALKDALHTQGISTGAG